ncbi:glycoside hydrolase family 95 protein [Mucilaginibacter sp. BJC16-A38]|uniref:glycoside hydrolase family 95 protein n=1 Tax=Mucilaginibacter phenanthrenivorans TaxID=1234842 RepID=UPI002157F829|nr:glycoside hydrolase family 95 protein [Mucilaginibacter phenanthrenivorans]MCR8559555.1 glycoside hydrolase family 95 protein [Mucilaginibacter phenanthrenivorans]
MLKKNLFILVTLFTATATFAQQPLKLWYDRPAQVWEETLPLGNGHLGMMPDGGVTAEKVVLNDITLWSGSPQDANNYEAYKKLPEIRQLLLAGKNSEAQALIDKDFICVGKGSGGVPFGCYQLLGDLNLKYDYKDAGSDVKFTGYYRELSLNNAIATSSFTVNGVNYKREYFTSFGDDVSVIRLSADKPGMLNFSLSLSRPERGVVSVIGDELKLAGQLDNGTDGKGMKYEAKLKTKLTGGSQVIENNTLIVKDATAATIYISAGTDFKNPAYIAGVDGKLAAAISKSYDQQKEQHTTNFQKLFNRVKINLGDSEAANEPTDKRLISFHNNPDADKGMPVLFYQFGRYLSICSTRVGLLPPNLQGLWANEVHTPWNGDYHLDVNVQMNHWPLEVSNLSELNLPLVSLVEGMIKHGEKTAMAYYNADGWIAHVITNVWGYTEPGESASWGITKAGAGWLCDNLWEHYAFTNDKAYLKRIYPILKGSAQFYNSILIKDPKTGYQVTAPSSSPENSFYLPDGKTASICMGATIDNQIIRELFNNVITASKVLGLDAAFSSKLQAKLKELPPPGRISKDGRIMEWLEDYKETEPQHRHISHLYGLYPASLITSDGTPDLAEAAKKTLNVRGDDGPSWSIAYKLLFWARLHDGNRAYKLFKEIMKPTLKTGINYGAGGGIYPNLLSAGPPFQIDGNFGTTAGIAEMLIQSNQGYIEFIPSIPDAWKATGEAKGLKARGGFTVDMKWADGKITNYRVASVTPHKVKIKINGEVKDITSVKL